MAQRTGLRGYLALLLFFAPIASFVVVPQVPGTTPGNLLVLLGLFPLGGILLFGRSDYLRLLEHYLPLLVVLGILFFASRYSWLTAPRGLSNLSFTSPGFILPLTMTVHVTQTIYLLVAVGMMLVVSRYYEASLDRYIFAGAWFLVGYGLVDWFCQSFLHINADLLSNRTFAYSWNEWSGSLRQMVSVGGLWLMRFKSLTGESSMYALTALCFLPLAVHRQRWWLGAALLASLLLTFSTTAYAGMAVMALIVLRRLSFLPVVFLLLAVLAAVAIAVWIDWAAIWNVVDELFIAKLTGEAHSGSARLNAFMRHFLAWRDSGPAPFLVGYGFGTARSTDLISTLLINVGLVGTALALGWIVRVIGRGVQAGQTVLALGLACVVVLMLLAVPEFSYLPPWMLAGVLIAESRPKDGVACAG
ncbi:MAG: hypothetical protein KDH17_18365 [Rhodocyclaceae bacterium]|nr:hypothetical protein [Rhodocyclaceae bacterium]